MTTQFNNIKLRHSHITIFPKAGELVFTQDTLNLYYSGDLMIHPKLKYYIIQGELTKDNRQHLQIYAQFNDNIRPSAIKKIFQDNTLHIQPITYGTVKHCRRYCTNEYIDSQGNPKAIFKSHKEFGDINQQGKRSDIEDAVDRIKGGEKVDEMLMTDTKFARLYCQYFRSFKHIESLVKTTNAKKKIIDKHINTQWRPWQQDTLEILNKPVDDRKIHWIYDTKGNTGKTTLAKYICSTQDAFYITGGTKNDILHAYTGQPVVILDLARDFQERDYIYEVMELLKNGCYLSTKYESMMKLSEIPHIIVFSNFPPVNNGQHLSIDRLQIYNIYNQTLHNRSIPRDYDDSDSD